MFEFYFQSGEFTGGSDFLGPFLGAASPVLIFFLQQWYEKNKAKKLNNQFESDKLNYLGYLIRGSNSYLNGTIYALRTLIDGLQIDPEELNNYITFPSEDLVRVVNIVNQENYYHSYVKRNPGKNYEISSIFSSLDLANHTRTNIQSLIYSSQQGQTFDIALIKSTLVKIIDEINILSLMAAIPASINHRISHIYSDYLQITRESGFKLRLLHNHLLEPLGEFVYIESTSNDDLKHLNEFLAEGTVQVKKLGGDTSTLLKKLTSSLQSLEDSAQVLKDNATMFNRD